MNAKERKIDQRRKMILHHIKNYLDDDVIMTKNILSKLVESNLEEDLKYLIEIGCITSEFDEETNEEYIRINPCVMV